MDSVSPNPAHLAQFEILRRLGTGGMAEVFLAKKRGAESTYKTLVVKRILPSFGASRRFKSMFVEEAQLATRLNHPNIVQVYEFFDAGEEGHVLAMEFVEGCDLGRLMLAAQAKGTRLEAWTAAYIIAEAAKGLHYAHEKRDESGSPLEIVHRDVSPQNLLVSFEGVVKIADFGIASARLFDDEVGVLKGKYGYMSPEQARAEKVDRRSDLYALGVIFWECLAGRALHGGLGGEALLDIVRSGVVEPPSTYSPDIPAELETIVMRLLAPRREDRFPTGREVTAAIGRALLAGQELVDGSSVEAVMNQLITREPLVMDNFELVPIDMATQAAAPAAKASERPNRAAERGAGEGGSRKSSPPPMTRRVEPREVRHVAVVTMTLSSLGPEDDSMRGRLSRALERLRGMLGDMAYKRGMRWVWTGELHARAIAGLTAKPARAAQDAAWLALETHEAIAGMNDDMPVPLGAGISIVRGIASGTRDPEGNLVKYILHDPVGYLADLLSKETRTGRTWVAGGVYRLVRREFRWAEAPTLEVPALAEVVHLPPHIQIHELSRSLSREEKAAEQAQQPNDLVGRDAEKAELAAALHATTNGNGGIGGVNCRAIVGELGIGKSALVTTFANELPENVRLLRVECSPVRQEVPFSTVADLIRDAIDATGEEPFDEVAKKIAHAGGGSAQGDGSHPLVARLAELATNRQVAHHDDEDVHYQRKLVVSGVRQLCAALALQQPVVLVVEGLQWADKASLELFAELLKSPDPFPILYLLVARPDDRLASILEGKVRIELHGLGAEEQARLVEARLGVRDGVRQICAELSPRVGGNPFYLLEMVDAMLERGTLEIAGETLARPEREAGYLYELPSTLEQLLADRISELPGREHAIVDWLAIAGGPLNAIDLTKLMHVKADEHVLRLCGRGLCDRKGEHVDFRHPLTRDVAYAALEPRARVKMHRELGEYLAATSLARGLSAAIVARHLAKGENGGRAADFYLEAAYAARSGYQTQLAVRYFQRAATYLPSSDPRRLEAHEALENLFRGLGKKRDRLRHLSLLRKSARNLATPRSATLALLRTARYYMDEGRLARGLPIAQKAAQVAHSAKTPQLEIEAELLVSELGRELGDVQGALAACDRALAACNPQVNPNVPPRVRAEVYRSRGGLLRRVGRVREATDSQVDAIAIFRRVGARRQEARAKNALAYAMFVQGRYEDAIALALESIQIDLSTGGRFQLAKTLSNIGQAYSRLGDMPRALAYLRRAREAHERYGDLDGHADTLLVSAEVYLELNDLVTAEKMTEDARAIIKTTRNAYDTAHSEVALAAIARIRRDSKTAITHAMEARRLAEHQALVAYHFYALALESAARVDAGEVHSATLLATTALGAVENLQGSEYGLEIRVLAADALKRAGSPQAPGARQRAVDFALALMNTIREERFRKHFLLRPLVAALFDRTPIPFAEGTNE